MRWRWRRTRPRPPPVRRPPAARPGPPAPPRPGGAQRPGGEGAEAHPAFRKLSVGAEADLLAAMAERAVAPTADPSGPHLGVIADALAARRALRFKYRPPQGQQSQRTVDPYS